MVHDETLALAVALDRRRPFWIRCLSYAELENQGIIETLAGKGCFVTENHSPLKKEVRRKMLADEIDGAIVQAHHFQVSEREFLDLVRERLEDFEQRNKANTARNPNKATS